MSKKRENRYRLHFKVTYPKNLTETSSIVTILNSADDSEAALTAVDEWLENNYPNKKKRAFVITKIEEAAH